MEVREEPLSGGRALGFVAAFALLFEYLLFTRLFDLAPAIARGGVWANLGWLRDLGLTAALGGIVAILALQRAGGGQRSVREGSSRVAGWTHALSLLAFGVLCAWNLGSGHAFSRSEELLGFFLWVLGGAGVVLTLLWFAFGPDLVMGRGGRAIGLGALLGVLGFFAGNGSRDLWSSLSGATLHISLIFLRLVLPEASADPSRNILEARGFAVEVAPGCSGLEGLGVGALFLPAFLWLLRERLKFPRALWIIPGGLLLIWLANSARVAAIVAIGALGAPELAVGAFHSKIGWILLAGVTLGLSALALRLPILARDRAETKLPNPALPYLLPELVLLGTALITGSLSLGHDPLYSLRIFAAGATVIFLWERYQDLARRPSLRSIALGLAIGIVWLVTAPVSKPDPATSLNQLGLSWTLMRAFGSVIIVPIAEELAFRGYLMRRLSGPRFEEIPLERVTLLGIAVSSVVFGLVHSRPWLATIAGFAYALLARRGLQDSIAAHVASNLVIAVWVIASRDTSHW